MPAEIFNPGCQFCIFSNDGARLNEFFNIGRQDAFYLTILENGRIYGRNPEINLGFQKEKGKKAGQKSQPGHALKVNISCESCNLS
jgi:hypothetical protein